MTIVYIKSRRSVRIQFHYKDAIRRTPGVFKSLPLAKQFAASVLAH